MTNAEILKAAEACFQDPDIRERACYPDFRLAWKGILDRALDRDESYFDILSPACYPVHVDFLGFHTDFHVDQLKIAEWYEKEAASRKKLVFFEKRLKRSQVPEVLMFHEAVCRYDPLAEEPALDEEVRNIVAAAVPGIPASMRIIYGNKWVSSRFSVFRPNSLPVFLIGTDYVPAFLGSPTEAAVYLFLMDVCIIKENLGKVKDEDLRGLLHGLRPSPMLRIKGLA